MINYQSFGELLFLIIFSFHIFNIIRIFHRNIKTRFNKYYKSYLINKHNVRKLDQEDKTCPICHEDMDFATSYRCQHLFHIDCLNEYINKSGKNCPVCRKEY